MINEPRGMCVCLRAAEVLQDDEKDAATNDDDDDDDNEGEDEDDEDNKVLFELDNTFIHSRGAAMKPVQYPLIVDPKNVAKVLLKSKVFSQI